MTKKQNIDKDTKDRVTPVAFAPDESLFDLPLARPWRRGGAMLCDLMIVAVLTALDSVLLVSLLIVLWLFHKVKQWRAANALGGYEAWVVRSMSFVIIAAGFYGSSQLFSFNDDSDTSTDAGNAVASAALIGMSIYKGNKCEDAVCWQPHLTVFIDENIKLTPSTSRQDVETFIDDLIREGTLPEQEKEELKEWALVQPQWQTEKLLENKQQASVLVKDSSEARPNDAVTKSTATSPMNWLLGIIDDLGLGFGFAAIYFTCFTAWFNGQTLGKMLFNTRVLQLSNKPMGLWEAFGRYGGYGAGLATGLLGFFQIYWDANRQAIQDQISATVVIDLTLAAKEGKRITLTVESEEMLNTVIVDKKNAQDDVLDNEPQVRLENEK